MREIKYRVWQKKEKKMYYPGQYRMKFNRDHQWYILINPVRAPESPKVVEAMEWVGLTDKTGRDAYVGDLVRVTYQTGLYMTFAEAKKLGLVDTGVFEIVWRAKPSLDGGYGGFYFKGENAPHIDYIKHAEIIGNVFEGETT